MKRRQRKADLMGVEGPDNILGFILGLCFLFIDWLSFGEGGSSFETGRARSREWKNFGRRWTRGVGVLDIGQFSWTSYVYHPFG